MFKHTLRNGPLREEASEHATDGGGATTQQAAPVAEAKPPGIIEQAMAGLRSKAALNAEIAQLAGKLQSEQARATQLEERNQLLEQQVAGFKADHARLEQAIQDAAEEKQTVDEAAAAKLASAGVPQAALPPAGQDAQDTAESLRDKLKSTTDPKERFRIQQRIDALETA
jgi:LPS O-antigen subunit length determinant protein (WzzB/FepE family)